jgi:hypothetical protein
MISFKQFIDIDVSVDMIESNFIVASVYFGQTELNESSAADDIGKYHELMYAWHSNGGKFLKSDARHDDAHRIKKEIESRLHPDVAKAVSDKAKRASDEVKKMITDNGHVHHGAYWSSKPGDIEKITGIKTNQSENASDVVHHITDEHGNTRHMGVSLKHTTSGVHVPTSNPGHGQTDKALGTSTSHHMDTADRQLNKEFPHYAEHSKKGKKLAAKSDEAYMKRSTELKQNAVSKIADDHISAFNSMHHNAQVSHIRNMIHAHETPDVPQMVVTSHKKGIRIENRAKRYHPNNIKKIDTERKGWNTIKHTINFNDGSKEEWNHRYKFESGPHSSLKASFERTDRNE